MSVNFESADRLFPRKNNINILRLLFANQVLFIHAFEHLKIAPPPFLNKVSGVPFFFFFSGFLIYASYLRRSGLFYFANRALRLLPGLIAVTVGEVFIILYFHGWRDLTDHFRIYFFWFIGQLTVFQAYNPSHFRDVGVGAINGTLWTMTPRVLFYLIVPLIVKRSDNKRILMLVFASFFCFLIGPYCFTWRWYRNKTVFEFLSLTPLVWGWMFGCGMLACKYFKIISKVLQWAPILIIPAIIMATYGDGILFGAAGNRMGGFYFLCFVAILLWFAFWLPPIPFRIDISYGLFLWHMPIINFLSVVDPSISVCRLLTAIIAIYAIALLSFILIEKPVSKLKLQL